MLSKDQSLLIALTSLTSIFSDPEILEIIEKAMEVKHTHQNGEILEDLEDLQLT